MTRGGGKRGIDASRPGCVVYLSGKGPRCNARVYVFLSGENSKEKRGNYIGMRHMQFQTILKNAALRHDG